MGKYRKPEAVCDVITLEGIKHSKTIKQLSAIYDIKGPIKGRVRKKRLRKGRTLRILGDEEQNEVPQVGKCSQDSSEKGPQEATNTSGGERRTLEDDIRELERELEEAKKISARGRGKLPGGDASDGANSGRRPGDGTGGKGTAGGVRVGTSSRFPRRGYPK